MQNDKIKEYWEGEAGIYSEGIKAELKSETAENWKNLILEYAPEKEHLEVLDVGCGPGFFEIMLGKEGHHVTGIDITENMIHEGKCKGSRFIRRFDDYGLPQSEFPG